LVAGAGGQDGDIARLQREYATLGAAEADASSSARDARYFMDSGAVVYVTVDAITPGVPHRFALKRSSMTAAGSLRPSISTAQR